MSFVKRVADDNPLVSIAMGVYNAQEYVAQSIESLLAQDYTNFELILSDNGSQDRSTDICRSYAKKDNRIILDRNAENINPLKNSVKMLKRTSGTYHMWAADHDLYHPKFISSLLNVFAQEDDSLILAYPDACHIDADNKPIREIIEDIETRGLPPVSRFKKVLWGLTYCTPIYGMYRSSALKKAFKMRWTISPDRVFMPEFSLMGTFAHIAKPLFFWRQNRPVEDAEEMHQRQVKWFVPNAVEALAPITMRDYELLQVVQTSPLTEADKEELFFEVLRRHHAEPLKRSRREARHLHYQGMKLLNSDDTPLAEKAEAAKDYLRVARISKIFCKECLEQLGQLDDLCLQYILGVPALADVPDPSRAPRSEVNAASETQGLIPPEIFNDPFYTDIKQSAAHSGIEHVLEIGSSDGQGRTAADLLPVHFFTIVLNGEPFIRYHIDIFKKLEFPWHWHIVEGVADLKHDTAWSLSNGGKIVNHYHDHGLSVDGTTAYLDQIALEFPDHVTVYRKPDGAFWNGKREMVSAPMENLPEHCLLWQIDADELWHAGQIKTAHGLFREHPERTAAFFHCHFFVGPHLVTTTNNSYSHNPRYEWIRLWRYRKGMQWKSHEPPCLQVKQSAGWIDTALVNPFTHSETEAAGLVFSHYAYALESQVRFKEDYYGYAGAVSKWRELQKAPELPVRLSDYFKWVKDGTLVDRVEHRAIAKAVPPVALDAIIAKKSSQSAPKVRHIVIDGIIFQLQAGRPQGIARVWRNLISGLRRQMPQARITILQRKGSIVPLDDVAIHAVPAFQWGDAQRLDHDDEMLHRVCSELEADIFISTYFTRAPGVRNLVMVHDLIPEVMGMDLSQPEWQAKQRVIETGDGYINVSQVTQNDLCKQYPQVANRPMRVAHNGRDTQFRQSQPGEITRLREKLGLKDPYFLLVGNRNGYKNGLGLFKTLAKMPAAERPVVLCVGGETRLNPEEEKIQADLDIRYAGLLDENDLTAAYGGAEALFVPSLYEGFGLPVVEAMACGCPVIAHQSPAVVEVGGNAVRYADFSSTTDIQSALRDVRNSALRRKFQTKGMARAKRFDWSESCRTISRFIEEQVAGPDIILTSIVSTYNAAAFIEGCLDDLEHQTIADQLEIIVVDSASEQAEAAVVRDFQRRFPNIKYIRTATRENVYQAWNRGIKFALGQYITNANTDDRHRQDAFEQMVGVMEKDKNIALVYADVIKTRTPNETFRDCTPTGLLHWYDWDRRMLLQKGCFIGPQPVWRKNVHQTYGYFDERLEVSSDFEFWLRISQTNEFYHISKPLGLYLDRPDSIEHANGSKKRDEDQQIIERYRLAAAKNMVIKVPAGLPKTVHADVARDQTEPDVSGAAPAPEKIPVKTGTTQGDNIMNSPEIILKAAEYLVDGGHKEAAYWVMGKLLVDFPEDARLHSVMAALAYDQGDMHDSLVHYERAVALFPRNTQYLKDLGDFYYVVQKDAESALSQYEKALQIDPDSIDTLVMAGHVSISLHRYKDARGYYQRVQTLDPQNSEIQNYLEKVKAADAGLQTNVMSNDTLYEAAQAKVQEDDRQAAISLLEQLLDQDDTHALAHNDLGVLNYETGNMPAALKHYQKAAELMPENENFQKNLADFYWVELRDSQRAMKTYIQALKLDPLDVEVHLSCGQICLSLGKKADARDFFTTALDVEPWNEDARKLMQQLEQTAGASDSHDSNPGLCEPSRVDAPADDRQVAINDLKRLLVQSPDNAEAHNDLGVLFYECGDKNNALKYYEQAVQLDPKVPNYRKNLADFYLIEQSRAKDAMKLYLSVLEDNPEDIESLVATGMVCAFIGKPDDAKHFYHRALEIEPWNQDAQSALRNLQTSMKADGSDGIIAAAG